ncbi:MAG: tRNA (uridine(34)/cytosine(34)/5-carboxymethylaminomethyluridine(34)-2'-O)-methyltransferase TrmL [Ruminococcaceae bacterium]|nr:tRNA (uridine(34)/cytosine(34)/5-carboxymethylaminomethyluridine(34)-2'-O)-methyltransferase TrmL [Oscillospiraceae bacterium]
MSHIHIVLVEPEIPQNTGNIARTCAATGATLHLVKPLGFTVDNAKLKRAGLDYWDKLDIRYYENLEEFLKLHENDPLFFFTTKAPRMYTEAVYPAECFLVFGKETAGLPEWLLQENGQNCVRIPMRDTLRSLNLSNCAAIAVYEALRQQGFPDLRADGEPTGFHW